MYSTCTCHPESLQGFLAESHSVLFFEIKAFSFMNRILPLPQISQKVLFQPLYIINKDINNSLSCYSTYSQSSVLSTSIRIKVRLPFLSTFSQSSRVHAVKKFIKHTAKLACFYVLLFLQKLKATTNRVAQDLKQRTCKIQLLYVNMHNTIQITLCEDVYRSCLQATRT